GSGTSYRTDWSTCKIGPASSPMLLYRFVLLSLIADISMLNKLALVSSYIALIVVIYRGTRASIDLRAGIACAALLLVLLGAITSVMVLVNLYPDFDQKIAVIVAIAAVGALSYAVLLAALPISRVIGVRGRAVFTKVMSLLLGAIGIQFVINGVRPVLIDIM